MLNAELADNIKFREDVGAVQASGVSAITVNFEGKDRIDLTRTGGALNITVAGLGDGELKYLLITKTAGQAITWTNVTDVTPILANVNELGLVLYEVIRKGSYYFARAWVDTVKQASETMIGALAIATESEHNALGVINKAAVPGRMPTGTEAQKGLLLLASASDVTTGTDDSKALTVFKGKQLINNEISAGNVMDLTDKAGNVTMVQYHARKVGKLVTGYFIARTSVLSTNMQVGTLGGLTPANGAYWYFTGNGFTTTIDESGIGFMTADGKLYMNVGRINENYVFNFVIPVA